MTRASTASEVEHGERSAPASAAGSGDASASIVPLANTSAVVATNAQIESDTIAGATVEQSDATVDAWRCAARRSAVRDALLVVRAPMRQDSAVSVDVTAAPTSLATSTRLPRTAFVASNAAGPAAALHASAKPASAGGSSLNAEA